MKNIITIINTLLCLVNTLSAQESTQEKMERLARAKCMVKSVTTTNTDYYFDGAKLRAGVPYVTSKSTCDKAGNISIAKTFNPRGTIESWNSYKYEKAGVAKGLTVHNTDGTVNVEAIIKNYYDSLGRHSDASTFVNDVFLGKNLYLYDEKGNMETANTYEALPNDRTQMRLTYSEIYKSDERGRRIQMTTHTEGSSSDLTTTFKYGENGNVSEKIDNYFGVYKYGASGLCTSITYYDSSNNLKYVVNYTYEYFTK